MTVTAIINEFAKMRHLRVWLVVALLLLGVAGLAAFQSFGSPGGLSWKGLLADFSFALTLTSPLLLAVLASRQVEIEHLGNGWLLSATSGVTPGHLCRAKFLALGTLIVAATILASLILIAVGLLAEITSPFPVEHWLGYTATAVVINLAVLAFHTVLSARIENQLVCLGVGVVGIFLATFGTMFPAWAAHLTPWSYYALTAPADFVGMELVYLDIPYLSVLALAVIGSGLFLLITARFDAQEA